MNRSWIVIIALLVAAGAHAQTGSTRNVEEGLRLPEVVITAKDTEGLNLYSPGKAVYVPELVSGRIEPQPDILSKEVLQPMSLRLKKLKPEYEAGGCFAFGWGCTGGLVGAFGMHKTNLKIGFYHLDRENQEKALKEFERIAEKRKRQDEIHAAAVYWAAEVNYLMGKRQTAWSGFKEVADHDQAGEFEDDALFSLGWLAYQDKQYAIARKYFRETIDADPPKKMEALAWFAGAQCAYFLDDFATSRAEFTRVIDEYPWFPYKNQAQFWAAESYYHTEQYELAEEHFRLFLRNFPADDLADDAHYGLAWTLIGADRNDEAAATLEQALQQFPSTPLKASMFYWLGRLASEAGETEEAVRYFAIVQEQYPNDDLAPHATRSLAWIAFEAGDYQTAVDQFAFLVRTAPTADLRYEADFMIGEARYAQKEYAAAREAYAKVFGAPEPYGTQALYKAGWCGLMLKDYEAAERSFQRLLAEYPELENRDEILYWLAETRFRSGSRDDAGQLYRQLLERYPGSPWRDDAWLGLAWISIGRENWSTARAALQALLAEDPETRLRTEALFKLGEAEFELGNYLEARDAFQEIYDSDPLGWLGDDALFALGRIAEKRKAYQRSLALFDEFLSQYPKSSLADDVLMEMGWTNFSAGDLTTARTRWQQVPQWYPESNRIPEAVYRMGETYFNQGRFGDARGRYLTVLQEFPGSPFAEDAAYSYVLSFVTENDLQGLLNAVDDLIALDRTGRIAPMVWFQVGDVRFDRGDYEDALASFRRVADLGADHEYADDALLRIGQTLQELGRYEEALTQYEALTTRFPESDFTSEARLLAGEMLIETERYAEAADFFRAAAAGASTDLGKARALYLLGRSLQALGKPRAAEAEFLNVLPLDPGGVYEAAAWLALGDLLRKQDGREREALEYLAEAASSNHPVHASEAQYLMGVSYRDLGNIEQARTELIKVSLLFGEDSPWTGEALLLAARLYEADDDIAGAVRTLRMLQRMSDDPEVLEEAHTALDRLEPTP